MRASARDHGLLCIVQGGQTVAERLMAHPSVAAVSFVGSSPVAAAVYRGAAAHGKRCQALGGAKNHLIVMPDADLKRAVPGACIRLLVCGCEAQQMLSAKFLLSPAALIGSCFGCAGQRCLAGSVVTAVGSAARQDEVVSAFVAAAAALRLGSGLEDSTTLPPLYSVEHRDRVAAWVDRAVSDGATLALDGRKAVVPGLERGAFLGACVLDHCTPAMPLGTLEHGVRGTTAHNPCRRSIVQCLLRSLAPSLPSCALRPSTRPLWLPTPAPLATAPRSSLATALPCEPSALGSRRGCLESTSACLRPMPPSPLAAGR